MPKVLIAGVSATVLWKLFTVDKDSSAVYVKAQWYWNGSPSAVDCNIQITNEARDTEIGSHYFLLNPAGSKPHQINQEIDGTFTEGEVIAINFQATDGSPTNWPGFINITISTDPIT